MTRYVLATLLALSLVGSAAFAETGGDTAIDAISVSQTASAVTVAGSATYGAVEHFMVGNTGAPATLGEVGQELGGYIEEAFLTQADTEHGDLTFNYRMRDIEFSAVPEAVSYFWDFQLRQADGTTSIFSIGGKAATAAGRGAPRFTLEGDCTQTGNLISCQNLGVIPGALDLATSTVSITVPAEMLAELGVQLDGAEVRAAAVRGGIAAQPSQVAADMFAFQYNVRHRHNYTAGRHVTVELVRRATVAGRPDTVVRSERVGLSGSAFGASLPLTGIDAGSYDLVTTVCFGSNCDRDVRPLSVE